MEEQLKEYIVTLHRHEDLDEFYEDMETPGGNLYIPNRRVEVSARRPISRNTHYLLTPEEAQLIKNDPRVFDVQIVLPREWITIKPRWEQSSSNWNKSTVLESEHKNWGLLRCIEGQQRVDWGSDNTENQTGTVTTTSSGKHVDVVIVDGHLDPSHPEFAVNSDGTDGSRVIQYNWYRHNQSVAGVSSGTYPYPTSSDWGNGQDNHGMHVAGTVAGNTQGWAREANIYNISPYYYGSYPGIWGTYANYADYYNASDFVFDYIREFHNNKSINPTTKRKNPTITNNSWGSILDIKRNEIDAIVWQGTQYTSIGASFSNAELNNYGITQYDDEKIYIDYWNPSWTVDVQDAIDAGVIVIAAGGNDNYKMDVIGGPDYNNSIIWTRNGNQYSAYYSRGSWNVGGSNVICVGSISDLSTDEKAFYSNCGPRVDVYAPGTSIISSVHDGRRETSAGVGITLTTANDPRNSSYQLKKYGGTSMASPQVCGVLVCSLEHYPSMNQQDCVDYLEQHSKYNQITDGDGTFEDTSSLLGSENKYLYYKKHRETSGYVTSQLTNNVRKSSGMMFPRRRHI